MAEHMAEFMRRHVARIQRIPVRHVTAAGADMDGDRVVFVAVDPLYRKGKRTAAVATRGVAAAKTIAPLVFNAAFPRVA